MDLSPYHIHYEQIQFAPRNKAVRASLSPSKTNTNVESTWRIMLTKQSDPSPWPRFCRAATVQPVLYTFTIQSQLR